MSAGLVLVGRAAKTGREIITDAALVFYDSRNPGAWPSPPPYGAETPEGWACTGPLIAKYELDVDQTITGKWMVSNYGKRVRNQEGPCAAVAEWVAQHVPLRAKEQAAPPAVPYTETA